MTTITQPQEKVFSKSRIKTAYFIWAGCATISLIYTTLYFYELASGASLLHIILSVAFGAIVVEGLKHLSFHGSVDSGGKILLHSKSLLLALVLVVISLLATQAFFHNRAATTNDQATKQSFSYERLVQKRTRMVKDADALRAAIDADLISGKYRSRGLRRRNTELKPLIAKIDAIDQKLDLASPNSGGKNQFASSVQYWTGVSAKQAEFWSVLFFALILELGQLYGIWVYSVGNKTKGEIKKEEIKVETTHKSADPVNSKDLIEAAKEAEAEAEFIPSKDEIKLIQRQPRQLTRLKSATELSDEERKKADDLLNNLLK